MATLKLKIKKQLFKRKIDGANVNGYIGRVITAGTIAFEDILRESTHGSTLDYREAKLAGEMMLDGIASKIKQGYIVDLGPLGKLYPSVSSSWRQSADDLALTDMRPKVNYKPSDDIAAAVRASVLQWTNEQATDENSVSDDEDNNGGTRAGGSDTGNGNTGGGTGSNPSSSDSSDGDPVNP